MIQSEQQNSESKMPNSYDCITVMEGAGLSGLRKYWFGLHAEPVQTLAVDEPAVATPVGVHALPHPMTRPEIEEWALENLDIEAKAIEAAAPSVERAVRSSSDASPV
jgi:hypothetical protein